MRGLTDTDYVLAKLDWMRKERIWPNGLRYLWTDAFGLVLLVSLYEALAEERYLDKPSGSSPRSIACSAARVAFVSAKSRTATANISTISPCGSMRCPLLGRYRPIYREQGVALVRQIHDAFVRPGTGVIWKMQEDLSGPYPGYGLGALDAFDGYVSYRLLDEGGLAREIAEMRALIDRTVDQLVITQDLGLGMMLWLAHFFPEERWAKLQRTRSLAMLDEMWQSAGYFAREPYLPQVRFAFTNYGVSLGLQAVNAMPERVDALKAYFETYRSGDEYDRVAITHVMAASSHFPGLLLRPS